MRSVEVAQRLHRSGGGESLAYVNRGGGLMRCTGEGFFAATATAAGAQPFGAPVTTGAAEG
jgi:hypothetical protein